jgi:hypothetical protein
MPLNSSLSISMMDEWRNHEALSHRKPRNKTQLGTLRHNSDATSEAVTIYDERGNAVYLQ